MLEPHATLTRMYISQRHEHTFRTYIYIIYRGDASAWLVQTGNDIQLYVQIDSKADPCLQAYGTWYVMHA